MINTCKFSVVMPIVLRDRISVLARKADTTRNEWIVRNLTRATRLNETPFSRLDKIKSKGVSTND